jgi:hypothetical protein
MDSAAWSVLHSTMDRASLSRFCPTNAQDKVKRWLICCAKLLICIAPQVALLTIYDMWKAIDRGMTITDVKVLQKHGGKSGSWVAGE